MYCGCLSKCLFHRESFVKGWSPTYAWECTCRWCLSHMRLASARVDGGVPICGPLSNSRRDNTKFEHPTLFPKNKARALVLSFFTGSSTAHRGTRQSTRLVGITFCAPTKKNIYNNILAELLLDSFGVTHEQVETFLSCRAIRNTAHGRKKKEGLFCILENLPIPGNLWNMNAGAHAIAASPKRVLSSDGLTSTTMQKRQLLFTEITSIQQSHQPPRDDMEIDDDVIIDIVNDDPVVPEDLEQLISDAEKLGPEASVVTVLISCPSRVGRFPLAPDCQSIAPFAQAPQSCS